MKKTLLLGVLTLSCLFYSQSGKVGINTILPHSSAKLEVSADAPPTSPTLTTKKGLLLPRVGLQNITDKITIPNPAKGLLIYNTADSGVYPNNVTANNYYFWDGNKWMSMPLKSFVEEAVKPRVFYIEGKDNQAFTPAQINSATSPADNLVTFSGSPIINVANIITKNANSTFTINMSGLYDFSAYVNYNPMNVTGTNYNFPGISYSKDRRAFLNVKIQILDVNGVWVDTEAMSRIGWGVGSAGFLKTANIISFPLRLEKDTLFRLVIANPFIDTAYNNHGNDGNSYIGVGNNIPVSKSIRVQLLDFNI